MSDSELVIKAKRELESLNFWNASSCINPETYRDLVRRFELVLEENKQLKSKAYLQHQEPESSRLQPGLYVLPGGAKLFVET